MHDAREAVMLGVKGKGPVYKLARKQKALMIEAVLKYYRNSDVEGLRILDIGCGNGDISQYFGQRNDQFGVDIQDKRKPENTAFKFTKVDSERLPFEEEVFDIVISHHVIEHTPEQKLHLSEMYRVLKRGGIAYLATPNKSSPIMQGHVGNNLVLRYHQMKPLFEQADFSVTEMSVDVVKSPRIFHSENRAFSFLPRWLLRCLRTFFPSHVFVLTRVS